MTSCCHRIIWPFVRNKLKWNDCGNRDPLGYYFKNPGERRLT